MSRLRRLALPALLATALAVTATAPAVAAERQPAGKTAREYLAIACPNNVAMAAFDEQYFALRKGKGNLKAALAAADVFYASLQEEAELLALLSTIAPENAAGPMLSLADRTEREAKALQSVVRSRSSLAFIRAYQKWYLIRIDKGNPNYANQVRGALSLPKNGWCPKELPPVR